MVDQPSENFRTIPNDSESFGILQKDSETFRMLPNTSERKESHILTAREVVKIFESAGVPRTERSIINWCHLNKDGVSRLDCFYDSNERKYFITPQSMELAIKEEQAKIKAAGEAGRSESELPKPSEPTPRPRSAESPPSSSDAPDLVKTLRARVRRLTLQTEVDKRFIEKLDTERQNFIEHMLEQSRQIGMLETEVMHYKELPAPRNQLHNTRNASVASDGIKPPIEVEPEPASEAVSPLDVTP